jgi:hypothetical protein
MYYGNPSAVAASNGNATFYFFDDFEDHAAGDTVDGWTSTLDYLVVDDGGVKALDDGNAGPIGEAVYVNHSDLADCAVRERFRSVNGSVLYPGVLARYTDITHMLIGGPIDSTTLALVEDDGGTLLVLADWAIPALGTGWHVQELRVAGSTASLEFDGTVLGSAATAASPPTGKTGFWSQDSQNRGYRDWHAVRKFAIPEPTVAIGAQEAL